MKIRELIIDTIKEYLNEETMEDIKKYSPQNIFLYVNKLHQSGWEKRKFDDKEWILSHKYFILKDVNLNDSTIKWNFGQHPPIVANYSKQTTELPPIVIGSNGYIIDGTHRAGAARLRGDKLIRAYIGID